MRVTKRVLTNALGWAFIALGIAGLLLPFLQGILFIALGIYLLSLHSPWVGERLAALKKRYPKHAPFLDRVERMFRIGGKNQKYDRR